ncbi:MAG TPA: YicC/YloC family endoribonuclease [Beijerinckiaceae bacterium]|nr:YicC/YloC family endoribonuclease [Beijerinckiaceae bacterium]
MDLKSMTGFARSSGACAPFRWTWELKAVNAKGLDLRLRLAPGFDSLEFEVRARLAKRLARGACYANLSVQRETLSPEVRVNEAAIAAILRAVSRFSSQDSVGPLSIGPLSLDGLLAIRGVVDVVDAEDDEASRIKSASAILAGLEEAIDHLTAARREEGAALGVVLKTRLEAIGRLTRAADDAPGRKPEAIRARLARLVAELTDQSGALDASRLHQEALLMAAKADVREELDRLRTHVAAAQTLLESGQPVGRRLDFLSQELGREANTLCAKSNDAALTTIGLEMRVEIEQFREQVQNIE